MLWAKALICVDECQHCFFLQEYGDLSIGKMKVAEFQGNGKSPVASNGRKRVSPLLDAVPSGDVPLEILRHKLRKGGSNEETSDIQRAIRGIEKVLIFFFKKTFSSCKNVWLWTRNVNTWKILWRNWCWRQLKMKLKRNSSLLDEWSWPIFPATRN